MAGNSSNQPGITTPSNIRIVNSLPRPEHLRTLWFDGTDVTEFLRRWNIECQDAGHDGKAKCERLPFIVHLLLKTSLNFSMDILSKTGLNSKMI